MVESFVVLGDVIVCFFLIPVQHVCQLLSEQDEHLPPHAAFFFCGVPQRTVMGPFLFSIHMLSVGRIIQKNTSQSFISVDIQLVKPYVTDICCLILSLSKSKYRTFLPMKRFKFSNPDLITSPNSLKYTFV